jgi:hypothetical protein
MKNFACCAIDDILPEFCLPIMLKDMPIPRTRVNMRSIVSPLIPIAAFPVNALLISNSGRSRKVKSFVIALMMNDFPVPLIFG